MKKWGYIISGHQHDLAEQRLRTRIQFIIEFQRARIANVKQN